MAQSIVKTPQDIKRDYIADIENGLRDIGVLNPVVNESSDEYVRAVAIADQISTLFNNILVSADQLMPDTATEDALDRIVQTFGLSRRDAGGATGQITITTAAPTYVPVLAELVNSLGSSYQVRTGGTYSDQATIDVISKDTGVKVNLAAGSTLTWVSPPVATQSTATVLNAITGAVDAEDDETLRQRLLSRLAHPPGSGNWQQLAELAESTDPVVQKAFVYPGANGAATQHLALCGYPSAVSKSRMIDPLKMNSKIIPTILGSLPDHVETIITTVVDVPTDVAVSITIPLANGASGLTAGSQGGGWLDVTPWPQVNNNTHYFIPITGVTDSTHFSVDSPVGIDPIAGVTRVCWIDQTTWTVRQATIQAFSGSGPYALTIDSPFVGVALNQWVMPASVNVQVYLDAILAGFKSLGPGEKTDLVGLLPRAARKPRPSSGYAQAVDSAILKTVIQSSDEVETAAFYYRSDFTPATQMPTGTVTPDVCTLITDAPNILIPNNLGFWPPFPLI